MSSSFSRRCRLLALCEVWMVRLARSSNVLDGSTQRHRRRTGADGERWTRGVLNRSDSTAGGIALLDGSVGNPSLSTSLSNIVAAHSYNSMTLFHSDFPLDSRQPVRGFPLVRSLGETLGIGFELDDCGDWKLPLMSGRCRVPGREDESNREVSSDRTGPIRVTRRATIASERVALPSAGSEPWRPPQRIHSATFPPEQGE